MKKARRVTGVEQILGKPFASKVRKHNPNYVPSLDQHQTAAPKNRVSTGAIYRNNISSNRRLNFTTNGLGNLCHYEKLDMSPLPEQVIRGKPAPPRLAHGLDRVIHNVGVHPLYGSREGDPTTCNFDPFLADLPSVTPNFLKNIPDFIPSSEDMLLQQVAEAHGKQYKASTSSISSILSLLYFSLSNFKPMNIQCLSQHFARETPHYTNISRKPSAVLLKPLKGSIGIDSDQGNRVKENQVLMDLGKLGERMVTMEKDEFEGLFSAPTDVLESYSYLLLGNSVLRSQLDARYTKDGIDHVFEVKTRATAAIRMNMKQMEEAKSYPVDRLRGLWWSYEREFYDLSRSSLLRFAFQLRIGRMDGVFLAYHNTDQFYGFEYLHQGEIDKILFGSGAFRESMFHATNRLLQEILTRITDHYGAEDRVKATFHTHRTTRDVWVFTERIDCEERMQMPFGGNRPTTKHSNYGTTQSDVQAWHMEVRKVEGGAAADIHPLSGIDGMDVEIYYKLHNATHTFGPQLHKAYQRIQQATQNYVYED